MKNPYLASGAGAFRVTSHATLTSTDDATWGLSHATPHGQRYRWCPRSNSFQKLIVKEGRIIDV